MTRNSHLSAHRSGNHHRGFALVTTLSLMVLLAVIAVGLLSLSAVALRSSSREEDMAVARANARLALIMALNELQRSAGPDQRVTAAADLAGNDNGERLANSATPSASTGSRKYWNAGADNGLSPVQAGTRYWTGVWGNANPSRPAANNGNIYEKAPSPRLLNWLVSGNESTGFTVDTTANAFGQVTGATTPEYTPGKSVSGLSASMSATSPVKIDNKDAVLLLGPASAGKNNHPTANTPAEDRYVAAPLVDVKSGTRTTGRYAYWVGDEGVKTRADLIDPYASSGGDASSDVKARYRLMTAPRSGLEVLEGFENSNYAARTQSANPGNNTAARAVSFSQINLIDSGGITRAMTQPRFHDITSFSSGVLADSYNGGLRKDLTARLEAGSPGSWTATNGQAGGTNRGVIPAPYSPVSGTSAIPRWNAIHGFNALAVPGSSSPVKMTSGNTSRMSITPVISQIRILSSFQIMTPTSTTGQQVTARASACPLFVISNPYNAPIESNGPLKFTIAMDPSMDNNASPYIRYQYGESTGNRWIVGPNNGGPLGGKTFKTDGAVTLPAGQSKIFRWNSYQDFKSASEFTLTEGPPGAGAVHGLYEQFTFSFAGPGSGRPGGNTLSQLRMGETNITSLLNVTLSDSTGILQEVAGLNVDLNYVGVNNISINAGDIVPCGVFVFDLNLPGQRDYGNTDGKHNSTFRFFADFNPRASFARFAKRVHTVAPYNWRTAASSEFATSRPFLPPNSYTDDTIVLYWGRAVTAQDSNGTTRAALYDLPRRASAAEIPLFSIAQFQHANLTADSTVLNPVHQPGYAVGNSYQSPFLRRGAVSQDSQDLIRRNQGDLTPTTRYFDISYLLNASLWDGYYFSTVPSSASGAPAIPVNPRLKRREDSGLSATTLDSAARDMHRAASVLNVNGAFNVNSTSVDAWAAFLGGMNNLPALSGNDTPGGGATFARSIRQPGGSAEAKTGDSEDAYLGFRKLTPAQVRTLAEAIVKQVRLRGPFVSLAQFVNRTLVDATSDTNGVGLYGPLQAAIDSGTDINALAFSASTTTDEAKVPPNNTADTIINGTYDSSKGTYGIFHPNAVASVADAEKHYATASGTKLTNSRSACIPGWLTQADVLQAVGPLMSARSDTFVIRAYGEARSPLAAAGSPPSARAWCEAVVQRTPDYLDPSTAAETPPSEASTRNQAHGRRFRVVCFRWLHPDEI